MNEHVKRINKPRCFLLYALAPSEIPASEANRILNAFIGDPALPLAIFHDHFIGAARWDRHLLCGNYRRTRCAARHKRTWMAGTWKSSP